MEYNIRPYDSADLKELTSFLNANHELDVFTEGLVKEKLEGDPYWDPTRALVAENDRKIIGFMLGVSRTINNSKCGFIKLMAVDKLCRRQGIATKLYRNLESQFIEADIEIVRIYDAPLNYLMPGVDPRYTLAVCWAQRMGFERFGDALNMNVDLNYSNWNTTEEEEKLGSSGILICRPSTEELDQVVDFVRIEWEQWENEIRMSFKDDPHSIHVAKLNGEIKAFSAHNANNKGTGWFGPMGTHPDLRGKGIGGILLKRCLKDMKDQGHQQIIIPWVAPIAFYAHYANAKIDRVFWRFEKKLS